MTLSCIDLVDETVLTVLCKSMSKCDSVVARLPVTGTNNHYRRSLLMIFVLAKG